MKSELQPLLLQWLAERADFGPLAFGCDTELQKTLLDSAKLQQARRQVPRRRQVSPERQASEIAQQHAKACPADVTQDPSSVEIVVRAQTIEEPTAVKPPVIHVTDANVAGREDGSQILRAGNLDSLREVARACQRCAIGKKRQHMVFGAGNPNADLVLVGEAPGAMEDEQGEPFVGPAGQLLTKMLAAIGFAREDVYICNILKCRPTNNRDPNPDEVGNCVPLLERQLQLIQPKLLLALGRVAGKTLLANELSLREMRGATHEWRGTPLRVTYHPAALLRNQHWKRPAWEDLQAAQALYHKLGGSAGSLS